jgi:uncharacterized protein with PIN domain
MPNKLKPCPLCGGKKLDLFKTVVPKRIKKYHYECARCHYCGKRSAFIFTAKIQWNRRTTDDT